MLSLKKIVVILGLVTFGLVGAADLKWWQTASFYQIYPRSFKDSDGDGVGDLKGVTQHLAYLKEIGIDATWLSPIFTSPMADFGYDIANFTEIDPLFGTMEDFDALLARARELGIKIILDFVPNHSSDECEWFIKSAENDPQYRDFYVWHPGYVVNNIRQPPTNWISVFRGSQWTWHSKRQAYYLHQFHAKQPDLNYRNPQVVEAMKDVLRFWLLKGVAGFRVDAVPHVFEVAPDSSGRWPDEPRNPYVNDPLDYGYLNHIYTTNQPETVDLVYEFRGVMTEMDKKLGGDDRILLTEAYAPIDVIMQYYGNSSTEGAQIPFNFELISNLNKDSYAQDYSQFINNWLNHMPKGRTANWVLGNHDTSRIGSRLGEDRMDMMNVLLLTLPGCSVTYAGEEIGMTNVWISWNDTVDPQACQATPDDYERLTRDPPRTPFQWNGNKFAGFTEGNRTWLPVSDNYKLVNVERERNIVMSHLNIYKQLQNLRREPTMRNGDVDVKAWNENVLAVKRFYPDHPTYVILFNINDEVELVNLHSAFAGISATVEYELVTDKSPRRKGDKAFADSISLMPKETVVLRTN